MNRVKDTSPLFGRRDAEGIFTQDANGEKVRLDDFEAQLIARSWVDAVGGRMADLSSRAK